MLRALVLVAIALCGVGIYAAEIFVATTGNDTTGDGSIANPFATIGRAHTAAADGDTITFRAGTYAGGPSISKHNLTLQSHTGEWAIIQRPNNVATGNDVALYVYSGSNITIRRLEIQGGYYYALKIDVGPALVEDCRIHGSGRDCVKIPGADYITIRRCKIYNSGQRDPSNAEGIDNVNGDYMLVQDCHIHDIATNGVYPKGGSIGSVIERCLIQRCGQKGISMAQSSGTQFYDTTANPDYYSCIDCVARNNIIEDCEGSGIDLESALRARVYNNTMVNVAKQFQGGIRISSADKGGTVGVVRCRDCIIRNNIIVLGAASARPMLFMGNNSHEGTLTMSNNRYYKTGAAAVYWHEPGQYTLDLAGWKTATGTDTNSTEGDPMLNASWHLAAGSPCIGQAIAITSAMDFYAFTDDYDGNTRTGAWDIGADQTGGTALPTPPAGGTIGTGGGLGTPGSPNGPTGLALTTSSGSTNLTWQDNSSDETGFRIERSENGGAFTTRATVAADTVTWSEPMGSAGNYRYRVVAYNAAGDSAPSNTVAVNISSVPSDPSNRSSGCTTRDISTIAILTVLALLAAPSLRVRTST